MIDKQDQTASFRKASSLSAAGTYSSPLGQMIMTSGMTNNGEVLTGLYFEGQKHFPKDLTIALEQVVSIHFCPREHRLGQQKHSTTGFVLDQNALSCREETDNHVFDVTRKWLDEYFAGHEPSFMPPVTLENLTGATKFRLAVWRILLTIPYGETITYGEIARTLQRQQDAAAPRAVGGAVGHNPISIIIPCHRVVGQGGVLTGYAGGVERKRWLLEREGIASDNGDNTR